MKKSILYIVATPIGNLGDISARALEILKSVDAIAAEDTRHSRRLCNQFQIKTPLFSLHEHNEKRKVEEVIAQLKSGKSIALISDAGTPLISDPGYLLVKKAREENILVVPIPGACALITALCVSGLSAEKFVFEGFLSAQGAARRQRLEILKSESRTLIFYEAPHRILDLLSDMKKIFGEDRYVVLVRELTKTFETIHGGTLEELAAWIIGDANQQKGEFVVLVEGFAKILDQSDEAKRILDILLADLPLKQAVQLAQKITGERKNKLYEWGLNN